MCLLEYLIGTRTAVHTLKCIGSFSIAKTLYNLDNCLNISPQNALLSKKRVYAFPYKNAFSQKMQFELLCYTVVSYQLLVRLSIYKNSAVYLSRAKNAFLHDRPLLFPEYKQRWTRQTAKASGPYHLINR